MEIANFLRNQAVNTELYLDPEVKLEKQLKYADRKGVPYVIIIGPDEAKKNGFVVKDLKAKKQQFCQNPRDLLSIIAKE